MIPIVIKGGWGNCLIPVVIIGGWGMYDSHCY